MGGKTIVEVGIGEVDEILQQYLWTTFHLAQAVVPQLVCNQWGAS